MHSNSIERSNERVWFRRHIASVAFAVTCAVVSADTAVAQSSFAYVVNSGADTVSAYRLKTNGEPVALPGSPYTTGLVPAGAAATPSGRFLYVANYGGGTCTGSGSVSASGSIPRPEFSPPWPARPSRAAELRTRSGFRPLGGTRTRQTTARMTSRCSGSIPRMAN
jgi:hypothetical protein